MTSSDSSETASDSLIIGILDDIREHVQLADLPEDLLAAIVRFADLEARAAGVAVCHALRSASERLSPRLEYSLVLRRFPLAASIVGAETPSTTNAPSPRGLFRTFANFEALGRDERPPRPQSTVALDDYTFSLEIELGDSQVEGRLGRGRESIYIGTGTLSSNPPVLPGPPGHNQASEDGTAVLLNFAVPAGMFKRFDEHNLAGGQVKAKVVASRRIGGRLQFAILYSGFCDDVLLRGYKFEWNDMPSNARGNPALAWALHNNWDQQIVMEPLLDIFWNFPLGESAYPEDREWQVGHPSTIDVRFLLGTADDDVRDMSLSSARVVMENYVAWSD